MEVISPFPLDSSLNLDFNSNKEFAVSFPGPSPPTDSFSTSSSGYNTFTPMSGCSTPLKRHTLDSSYPQNTVAPTSRRSTPLKSHTLDLSYPPSTFFDMNPLPAYAPEGISPEYKPDMTRDGYLEACIPEGLPGRQSVEGIPSGYSEYMEMSMPQTYSTSAPVDPPAYDMYAMTDRYRGRPLDAPVAANTVYMSDICKSEPYDLSTARPSLSSMAAFGGAENFRGSDSDSVASHSVLSPIGSIPSPELSQQLVMVNIGDQTGSSRRPRGSSASRGGAMDQVLMSPSDTGDDGQLVCEVKTVTSGKQVCKVPGCNKSFNRKEHLKRHEKATHDEVKIKCPFCKEKQEKPFNRWDNFKHHIKMHSQDRQHGRVEFIPEAVAYYAQLVQDTKPRTQRRGSAGKRPGAHRPRRYDPRHSM